MVNVLIAEDSKVVHRILKTLFAKDKSIKIVGEAFNGEEAIAMTQALHPDIVVMDYRMPKLSGSEAIKTIMHNTPTPILVFSSAEPVEKIQEEVLALGAVGFMAKPKTMDYDEITARMFMNIKTLSKIKVKAKG